MGEITNKAQALADEISAALATAINATAKLEKIACVADERAGMKACNCMLIKMRQAKRIGMESEGILEVQTRGGST